MSKRKDLSFKEKSKILAIYDNLPKCSQREAASKLGISQSTLSTLLKNRNDITAQITANGNLSRKRMRVGKSEHVEVALLEWLRNARLSKTPISRRILCEKAEYFAQMMGVENFTPTDGWLTRWKLRNNIACPKPQNSNFDPTGYWNTDVLPDLLKEYDPTRIFNAGETGLFYRALPEHVPMFEAGGSDGCEKIKRRVTVLLTCNMAGTVKKTPLVIGGSKEPRSFKGVKNLPVVYRSSKKSLMTAEIFTDFLEEWNKKLTENIALILDCRAVHPMIPTLERIKLVFLPPYATTVIQPLDRGIIRAFKYHYRKELARKAATEIDLSSSTTQSVSLLDAVHYIRMSWDRVTSNAIRKCFLGCGFKTEETGALVSEGEDDLDGDFLRYVEIDKNLRTSVEVLDFAEQCSSSEAKAESMSEDEESDGEVPDPQPTAFDVRKALQTLRRVLETHDGKQEMFSEYYSLSRNIEHLITPS